MIDQFRACLLALACGEHSGAAADQRAASSGGAAQQMLSVLEGYCDAGGFDPHDMADRLQGLQSGASDNHAMAGAIARLRLGYNFERASYESWKASSLVLRQEGSCLLRAAPTGLLRYFDNIHLVGESRVICSITHHDELCRFCCAVYNIALAHLMLLGVDGLLDELIEFAGPRNAQVTEAVRSLPALGPAGLPDSANVVDMLQCALWVAHYCDSLEEGYRVLAGLSSNNSDLRSIAGALLGAQLGPACIPGQWLESLPERERIERGARRLYDLAMQG